MRSREWRGDLLCWSQSSQGAAWGRLMRRTGRNRDRFLDRGNHDTRPYLRTDRESRAKAGNVHFEASMRPEARRLLAAPRGGHPIICLFGAAFRRTVSGMR